jgi:hypothetical protein
MVYLITALSKLIESNTLLQCCMIYAAYRVASRQLRATTKQQTHFALSNIK